MNVGEAIDVQVVVQHLLTILPDGRGHPDPDQVKEALMRLSDRARKTLMAGPDSVDVQKAWRKLYPGQKRKVTQ
jgi:uncharacterized protein with von Willebrand factor type A (vWA) domain